MTRTKQIVFQPAKQMFSKRQIVQICSFTHPLCETHTQTCPFLLNLFSVANAILETALSVRNNLSSIDFNHQTTLIIICHITSDIYV